MRRLVTTLALFVMLAAGCGGDGGNGNGGGTAAGGGAEAETGEQRAAAELLLTVEDLPTGWTVAPDDGEEGGEDDSADEFCKGLDITKSEVEPSSEAEADFQGGQTGPFASQLVAVYDGDKAEQAFDELVSALEDCKEVETADEDGTFTGSLTPVSFPTLGDETHAVRLTGTAKVTEEGETFELSMSGDFVFVRDGDVMTGIFQFAFDFGALGGGELDSSITEDLATKAAAKIAA